MRRCARMCKGVQWCMAVMHGSDAWQCPFCNNNDDNNNCNNNNNNCNQGKRGLGVHLGVDFRFRPCFSWTLCQISLKLGGCLSYAKIALEPRPHVPENSGPWEILICVCFLCGPVGPQNTTFWAENRFFRHEMLWLSKICCHLGEPPFDCGSSHVKIFHQLPRDRALGQF